MDSGQLPPKFRGAVARKRKARPGQITITLGNADAVFVTQRAAELGKTIAEFFRALLHQAMGAKLPIVFTPHEKTTTNPRRTP